MAENNKHSLLHKVSEGQKSGSSLAGWFWLGISHEVSVELLAGAAVSWRLVWGWKIHFKRAQSHGCWQKSSVHPRMAVWVSSGSWLLPEQLIQDRKNKQEAVLPFITKTLKSHTIIFTLFFRGKSLSPTHSWREQDQRICRHLKTCTTIHGLLFALQFQWRQWSYHFPYPGIVPLFEIFISFSQNLKNFIHYYSSCIFDISLSSLCFPSAFKHFLKYFTHPFLSNTLAAYSSFKTRPQILWHSSH